MNEDGQERVIHAGRLLRNTSQQIFIVEDPCLFASYRFTDYVQQSYGFLQRCAVVIGFIPVFSSTFESVAVDFKIKYPKNPLR